MMNIFKQLNQRARAIQRYHGRIVRATSMKSFAGHWVLVFLFSGFTSSATAQCLPNETLKLTASDATCGDHFGTSVSISGDIAVVGAKNGGDLANSGAVYVYRLTQDGTEWIEEQRLVALDAGAQDEFGRSVYINPIDSNVIIVGAWANDDACPENVWCQSGAAYIFRYNSESHLWVQEQKLTASDASEGDYFGWSVSIWGDVAIVGAKLDDDPTPQSGSAYIFRFDTDTKIWVEEQKLIPPSGGRFGSSVVIKNDLALVGAPVNFEKGTEVGAVYFYRYNPQTHFWDQKQQLLPLDLDPGAAFGHKVSLSGDFALIGAPFFSVNGMGAAGGAYIFELNGEQWIERQILTSSMPGFLNVFGISVSLQDFSAVIGAQRSDDLEVTAGSASIFNYDPETLQWTEHATLHSSDLETGDLFGRSVSIDSGRVIIGAHWDDDAGTESGSAYIFGGLGDCNDNGIIDICDIADGNSADKNNNGLPDECDALPCPWDMDNSGAVGTGDLIILFAQWGTPGTADFDESGAVGTADLLILFANWGPCG